MGLLRILLFYWLLCNFCTTATSISVRFLQAPPSFSNNKTAYFAFHAFEGQSSKTDCSNCTFICKLDDRIRRRCEDKNVSFMGLEDGHHSFMACAKSAHGASCATHNWTVDTVPPTAYITARESLTNAVNVTVNISFTEPCGFGCLTTNTCNLLVYGSGQVMPQTLTTLQPNLKYSITIALSSSSNYGRAILIMDKGFCVDAAGNRFRRRDNSSFIIHFDRRDAVVSLRTRVPEKLVEINGQARTVRATNDDKKLKIYLYFSQTILNTSEEILTCLNLSHGKLQSIQGASLASRRFGYLIKGAPKAGVVTVSLIPDRIMSRQGNRVSPVAPATLLYDSERPGVILATTSKMRTKEKSISISITFTKVVFGFNSTQVYISGGHIQSFREVSRNYYVANVEATGSTLHVGILENVTSDVAGNKNLPSNVLKLWHYSTPLVSIAVGYFVTASFLATCLIAGLLTVSTAILLSSGALSRSPPSLTSDPSRNLFRIACYIQVFALSRWMVVNAPVEYDELTACLKWSIPYYNLPWEKEHHTLPMFGPAGPFSDKLAQPENMSRAGVVYGAPLTETEYMSFFQVYERHGYIPQAEYLPDPQYLDGWMEFKRSMFWAAVIIGGAIVVHVLLLVMLNLRGCSKLDRRYGALIFPRFEIFLLVLWVPCICKASVSLIKGGTGLGSLVGVVLLVFVSLLQIALFVFLSFGITLGKLLQYKEIHQVGQKFHWYQELVRVTLGPGKRGQWAWKDQPNSTKLARFGPLFEDLRGPPKYMLSQFTSSSNNGMTLRRANDHRIIDSDDETEDAEAPFIQKLFGVLRIYYTFLDSIKRFALGVASGLMPSTTPTLTLLVITSFQLSFLLLKKPFIKKRVQLVEIVSMACQVGTFATLLALADRASWAAIVMVSLFLLGYSALLISEWHALWKQIRRLDVDQHGFGVGLTRASAGLLLACFPEKLVKRLDKGLLDTSDGAVPPPEACTSPGSRGVDKAWVRQLRELAKAGYGGGGNHVSGSNSRWSRFWSQKRSGSSSMSSSKDYKSKAKSGGLYKDLEAIFADSASASSNVGLAEHKS